MEPQDQREMPKYMCCEVYALKIKSIDYAPTAPNTESDGSAFIIPFEPGYGPVKVDFEYMTRHKPQPGGYYVVYKDGYKSFSPAQAFEEGYTLID